MDKMINKKESYLSFIICSGLVFSSINGIARFFFSLILDNPIIGSFTILLIWIVILFWFLFHYSTHFYSVIMVMIGYILFIFLMFILYPLSREWIIYYFDDLIIYLFVGMPMLVLTKYISSWEMVASKAQKIFRTVAILIVITYFISRGTFFSPMEWGNRVVPITLCYLVYLYYQDDNVIDRIIFCLLFFTSLMGGRQSLATSIFAIILFFLMKPNRKTSDLFWKIAIVVLFIYLIINFDAIVGFALELLERFGIYSRGFTRLADNFFTDSGRRIIYDACKQIIKENGARVNGIFSDHYFFASMNLGRHYTFAHNFVYEILIDFGTVLGGMILLLIFVTIIMRIIECKKEYRYILYIFIIYGIARILVSSSIFIYFNFAILFGFLLNEIPYTRKYKFVFIRKI